MIWWLLGGFGSLGVVAVGAGWWLAGRPEVGVHAAPARGGIDDLGSEMPELPERDVPPHPRQRGGNRSRELREPRMYDVHRDDAGAGHPAHASGDAALTDEPVRWPEGRAPVPGRVRLVLDGAAQLVAVAGLVLQDA